MKKVTVIVPFYNSCDSLRDCLIALREQTYRSDAFQVIAVDNGSTDNVADIKLDFPEVHWLVEMQPGSNGARNKGIRHATGEIIAFTDSDCVPAPIWLEEAVKALETSNATFIGGRIDYLYPKDRDLNIYERLEEEFFLLAKHKYLVERLGMVATANIAAYRSVFDRVGTFDPSLMTHGDGEWAQRATSQGEILRYADSALVCHPRRNTFRKIFRKAKWIAGGRVVLMKRKKEGIVRFVADVYGHSILSPRVHYYALFFPKIEGLGCKLRMFFLVELLSLANTFEKMRILLGGKSNRG